MNESQLIGAIRTYLKTIPHLFFWKEHGGMYGTAGIPDIICCYRGRFLAFEAKVQNNKATTLQKAAIMRIRKAGGYALIVHSVDEVRNVIEAFARDL